MTPFSQVITRTDLSRPAKNFEQRKFSNFPSFCLPEMSKLQGLAKASPLGTALINFGRDYPNQTFAGFIEAGAKIATDRWIGALAGKIIGISGKIKLYQGKPQIKLLSINQIKLVDSHSVR